MAMVMSDLLRLFGCVLSPRDLRKGMVDADAVAVHGGDHGEAVVVDGGDVVEVGSRGEVDAAVHLLFSVLNQVISQ